MPADTTPLSLFYCYARKDLVLRDELDAHLTGLRRSGYIATWYDGELIPGESWEQTIEHQLNTADIILLLVSPDFIKSDYCFGKEMTYAIARHTAKVAYVVPILLRPVDWTDAPFASLQMLPSNVRAVTSSSWFNRDEAFEDVARGLRRTVLGLLAQRRESAKLNQFEKALTRQGRPLSFAVGAYSDPGIKLKSKPNKDSLFAAQGPYHFHSQQAEFGFFVVADGRGGHANGQDASRRAIQTIVDYMVPKLMHSSESSPEMLESLLQDGVQQANQAVHRNNMELRADMGTTITATLIVGATAYVCNVGDSRTYHYRQSEGLRKVTIDHSVVASLVETGIIHPDDIYTDSRRDQLYRYLGEKKNVEVDSFRVSLQSGDKLLLCSDGLWSIVRHAQIEDVIKNPLRSPNQNASDLIRATLDNGGEDNVSVIVISAAEPANYGLLGNFRLLAKPESLQMPPM